jgi:hypothetical protein
MPFVIQAVRAVVPLVGGATAAAGGVLLIGWPHRPPLPGFEGLLAAALLVAVALLLVFVPALPTWRRAEFLRARVAPRRDTAPGPRDGLVRQALTVPHQRHPMQEAIWEPAH